jgi:hypothetical protein
MKQKIAAITSLHSNAIFRATILMLTCFVLMSPGKCQNVGIGTETPAYPLHVIGTARASTLWGDYGRFNNYVRIGLVYDNAYKLHVSEGNTLLDGDLKVNNRVGLGGEPNPAFKLYSYGSGYFSGNLEASSILKGGSLDVNNAGSVGTTFQVGTNLAVGNNINVTNDGIIDGNFRVNGRVGIGGATQSEYKLIVNNGNSYFQGNIISSGNITSTENITAAGTLNAAGDLIIKGNGHVRSNGSSNLRIGFDQKTFNSTFGSGEVKDFSASITPFDDGSANVRVSICQFDPDPEPQYAFWPYFSMKIYNVDAVANTCTIRIWNQAAAARTLKGVLYLMCVAKD